MNILALLKTIPRNKYRVIHSDVPIYSDSKATVRIPDVSAVIMRPIDLNGQDSSNILVLPTSKPMSVGTDVSWEWNPARTFPAAWYRSPETGAIKSAWQSSAEFIGRDLNTI